MQQYEQNWKLNSQEFGTEFMSINSHGNLAIKAGGSEFDVYDLVRKYGTPLEILVPEVITNRVRWLRQCFTESILRQYYQGSYVHCYPLKSNPLPDVVRAAVIGGASVEVGTRGEAYVAEKLYQSGELSKKSLVICNGAKEEKYLETILTNQKNSYNIVPVIEAEQEYFLIKDIADKIGLNKTKVGLRVRTGIDLGNVTHWNSATEQNPFGLKEKDAISLVKDYLLNDKSIKLEILHCHTGSQIESLDGIIKSTEALAEIYTKLRETGVESISHVDIGGGLPIPYDKTNALFSAKEYATNVVASIKKVCAAKSAPTPNIIVEAGRWSCAPAQITVFGTLYTKPVDKELRFVRVDGSLMTDLPDTWGVSQFFWILPVNSLNKTELKPYWLAGMTCDSDDVYPPKDHSNKGLEDLPSVQLPDIDNNCYFPGTTEKLYIAVLDTGAYQDSLSGTKGVKHCLLPDSKKIKITFEGKIDNIFDREGPGESVRRLGWKFNNGQLQNKAPVSI